MRKIRSLIVHDVSNSSHRPQFSLKTRAPCPSIIQPSTFLQPTSFSRKFLFDIFALFRVFDFFRSHNNLKLYPDKSQLRYKLRNPVAQPTPPPPLFALITPTASRPVTLHQSHCCGGKLRAFVSFYFIPMMIRVVNYCRKIMIKNLTATRQPHFAPRSEKPNLGA